MTAPSEWTPRPARAYSWQPFEANNEAALQHGAWSERKTQPIVERLLARLEVDAPWTSAPAFERARLAWARAEAAVDLLHAFLDEHGMFDANGNERAALRALARFERAAARQADRLGLDPTSLAKLLSAVASLPASARRGHDDELERWMVEGRAVLASRDAQLALPDGGHDDH